MAEKVDKKVLLEFLDSAAAAPKILIELLVVLESLRTSHGGLKHLVVSAVDPLTVSVSVLTSPRSAELCYISSTRKKLCWFLRRQVTAP